MKAFPVPLSRSLAVFALAMTAGSLVAAPPARAEAGPVWITLGTGGGPLIRQKRSEPANVLAVGETAYLFDCGEGTLRRLAAASVPLAKVKAVFVSHHHIDHDAGLGALLMQRWLTTHGAALEVVGPAGTKAGVRDSLQAGRADELAPVVQDGRSKTALGESAKGTDMPLDTPAPVEVYRDANLRVLAVINTHFHFSAGSPEAAISRSDAFRVEVAGRSFVYTGDTGPSEAVTALAKGADVLVSEVMDPVAMQAVAARGQVEDKAAFMRHMLEDHLTPDAVGQMAAAAGVGQVVLTHIVPGFDRETSTAAYSDGVKRHFFGPVTVAADLQQFSPSAR